MSQQVAVDEISFLNELPAQESLKRFNGSVVNEVQETPLAIKKPPPVDPQVEQKIIQRLRNTIDGILVTGGCNKILASLADHLKKIFNCQNLTFYAVDRTKRQLFSRSHLPGCDEVRKDICPTTLAGYVASSGKITNIANVFSVEELKHQHPDLCRDPILEAYSLSPKLSALVVALPYNKRLMGVLELLDKNNSAKFSDTDIRLAKELSGALGHAMMKLDLESIQEKIQAASFAINSATSVDEILLELQEALLQLFDAQLITIYAVDSGRNQIYSKIKSQYSIEEIRLSIANTSIEGCTANLRRSFNVMDVNDKNELRRYHPELKFDDSWEDRVGLSTKSMLTVPLTHGEDIVGVLQLINKKHGGAFTPLDEISAKAVAKTLALALFNQQKYIKSKRTKFSHMLEQGMITERELNEAIARARTTDTDMETVLIRDLQLNRRDVGKSLEAFYEVPYCGYSESMILPVSVCEGLNTNYLLKNNWVPLQNDAEKAVILIDDPTDMDKIRHIKMIFPKKKIELKVGLNADIRDFLESLQSSQDMPEAESKEEAISSLLDALEDEQKEMFPESSSLVEEEVNAISETDSAIVRLVNKILIEAYNGGVSDIHLEPGMGKKSLHVRFRKDGVCRVFQEIPYLYKQAIISRVKIMAKLDIAERRMPQDGKIRMRYGRKEIEYRVATCPTVGGNEDAVLRILAASKPIPLPEMYFSERNLKLIKQKISKPYGLFLAVGPTGSGKTTTLHSCLGHINTPERKIWTAEDPVEITQKGLRQVQMLNKIGLNFATAMRSFLRGDPDVIMVGEMRDRETAAIGLEASLTGHLVFSTLHTNSAPETITRLLDMGMNPLNFADALLLILAQRLVRTLCAECKEEYHPDRKEFDVLVKEYGKEEFAKLGIKYNKDLVVCKPVGCDICSYSGYLGRMALHELLAGSDAIKRMIVEGASVANTRKQAIDEGMCTLKQDGILKIFKGHCDLKQVLAVSMV